MTGSGGRPDGAMRPILVVDDDAKILELVRTYLVRAGHDVVTASDGDQALVRMRDKPALIVLDVMLPGVDGLELTRHLRENLDRVPILIISARGTVDDRIRGLIDGADDYMSKPFSPAELVERVNALLRRSEPGALPTAKLRHHDLELDLEKRQVKQGNKQVDMSDLEFRLTASVLEGRGRVLSRQKLIDLLYDTDRDVLGRTIDVVVRRIRAKLHDNAERPRYIATVRGVGYRAAP